MLVFKRLVGSVLAGLAFGAIALASAGWVIAEELPSAAAKHLAQKFARPNQTLEYHFMLKAAAVAEDNRDQVLAGLNRALKPIGEIGKLEGPTESVYLDTRERVLDQAHLILRVRSGLLTVKARATSLEDLIDLKPCETIKYEEDYLKEVGYSISSELKLKKEDRIADPSKASVQQVQAFFQKKCPALAKQLEKLLNPIGSLTAPGVAKMYAAEFKLNHPPAERFKDIGFSAWTFPGSKHSLAEVAWTGYVKDKVALDRFYNETLEKLSNVGLLAQDQSSKTEQYFYAFYGSVARTSR
jgi:hypothetical protein